MQKFQVLFIQYLETVSYTHLNKPISLLVNSIEMIEKVAKDITEIEYDLIKRFLPGPLDVYKRHAS